MKAFFALLVFVISWK